MELQNQNLKIIVAYKGPSRFSMVPALLEVNGQEIRLSYLNNSNELNASTEIFKVQASEINKATFTFWWLIIKTHQTTYSIVLSMKNVQLMKNFKGLSDNFTISKTLHNSTILNKTLRSLGIKTANYSYVILTALIIFLILVSYLFFKSFIKF